MWFVFYCTFYFFILHTTYRVFIVCLLLIFTCILSCFTNPASLLPHWNKRLSCIWFCCSLCAVLVYLHLRNLGMCRPVHYNQHIIISFFVYLFYYSVLCSGTTESSRPCCQIIWTTGVNMNVSCGVPKVSVLGQLLLLIYLWYSMCHIASAKIELFVDDTSLF